LAGLGAFAREYYSASNGFARILAVACARMPTDELRLPFVQNLWDEHGQGDVRRSHRSMLRRFLDYLQVAPEYESREKGPAARYVQSMTQLCQEANEAAVIGALGPGCEYFTPREYRLIATALRAQFSIPDEALEFFLDHISHDDLHIGSLDEALGLVVKGDGDMHDAIEGAKRSIQIEITFWEDMYSLLFPCER